MVIRLLQIEEIPMAISLARGVFDYELRPSITDERLLRYVYEYVNEENTKNMIMSHTLYAWGAFEGNNICGISAMQPEGHINMLYVHPYFRKRGIGKKLLREMRWFAKEQYGLERVTVSAMPTWTTRYFLRNSFSPLAGNAHADYVYLEAKTIHEVRYPVKPIRGKTIAVIISIAVIMILAISIAFLTSYMLGV